jgi:DNA-binding IclR family transcriptional regulator
MRLESGRADVSLTGISRQTARLDRMNAMKGKHAPQTGPAREAPEDTEGARSGAADRHFVTALARGLEVLSCFGSGDDLLANHEIAARCGLPKSTVTRLTYTLTKLDYLHYAPASGRYRLGTATMALGSAMLTKLDVRQVARPLMQQLAQETSAQVSLGTRDRLSMLYIENCRGSTIVTLSLDVGSRIPLATTAIGRAYLAAAPSSERADLMERIHALDELAWPTISAGVETALAEYRATGCVSSIGEWVKEIHAIAVPFNPGGGLPLMAVNAAGPAQNFPREKLLGEVRPKLIEVVRSIEERVGQRR